MNEKAIRPTRSSLTVELSTDGYLSISRDDAEHFFPEDVLTCLWEDETLILVPKHVDASGGLKLKQRNIDGDRSLLIAEIFDFEMPSGFFNATWDTSINGLRVTLDVDETDALDDTDDSSESDELAESEE